MPENESKPLPPYRPNEAAARMGVSKKAVIDAAKSGRLTGARLGRVWLINREEVDRLARGEAA